MKLNKTCCNLVNFCSCFIVHSLGMGLYRWASFSLLMGQFSSSVAAQPCTNEVEATPTPGYLPFDNVTNTLIKTFIAPVVGHMYEYKLRQEGLHELEALWITKKSSPC